MGKHSKTRCDAYAKTEDAQRFISLVPQIASDMIESYWKKKRAIRDKETRIRETKLALGYLISNGCEKDYVELPSEEIYDTVKTSHGNFQKFEEPLIELKLVSKKRMRYNAYKVNIPSEKITEEPIKEEEDLTEFEVICGTANGLEEFGTITEGNTIKPNPNDEIYTNIVRTIFPNQVGEDEIYRPFVENKRFLISNYGNAFDTQKNTFLRAYENGGYLSWFLCDYTKDEAERNKWKRSVHGVVAPTFLEKPKSKEKLEVDHKDGNKKNNCVRNLHYVTHSQNVTAQDVQERKEATKTKNKFMAEQIDGLNEVIKSQNKQIQVLGDENSELYGRIKELEATINSLTLKINDGLEEKYNQVLAENAKLKKQVEEQTKESASFFSSLKQLCLKHKA